MKPKNNKKLFCVQKYVWAKDVPEALRVEKKQQPTEIFIDSDWKKNATLPKDAIGFEI